MLGMLMVGAVVAAQPPDFSGRWVPKDATRQGTPGLETFEPAEETISQTGHVISVSRRTAARVWAQQHVADNVARGESDHPGGPAQTTTAWQGGRLVTTCVQTLDLPGGSTTLTTREVRWLEGGEMLVEHTWTRGAASLTRRVVYRRAE